MFYNSRWYDPHVGRFTQPDSFKGFLTQPGTQHPYAYVGNNPINRLDPTGHYDIPTPEKSGLDNTTVGSDGLTDYTRDVRDHLINGGATSGGGGGGGGGDGESRPPTLEERNQVYSQASQPVSAKYNVQTGTLKQAVSYARSMPGKPGTGGGGRPPGVLIADNSFSSVGEALIKAKNDAGVGIKIFINEAPGAIKNFTEEAKNAPVIGPTINFILPNELDAHIGTSLGPQAKFAGYFVQRIAGKKVTSEILELIVGKGAGNVDILSNKTLTNQTGKVNNYESATKGFDAAKADFDALKPSNVRTYPNGTTVGELPNGTTVNVRPSSSGGHPTVEIYNPATGTSMKIRY